MSPRAVAPREEAKGRRRSARESRSRRAVPIAERGAATVDFVLVSVLVIILFLAALQLGLTLHVRNTLIAYAGEGARLAARADSTPRAGVQRTRELISAGLSPRFASDVHASTETVGGTQVVRVRVRAPLPVVGLLGPSGRLEVSGRAYAERQ